MIKSKIEYCEFKKIVQNEIRNDIKIYRERVMAEYVENAAMKKYRRKMTASRKWMMGILKEGQTVTDRNEILQEVTTFYENLYDSSSTDNSKYESMPIDDSVPEILMSEVLKSINELKNDKATGSDDIFAEHIKLGKEEIAKWLLKLFNKILKSEEIPDQWYTSILILLFKKGNPLDLNNYRPISLISINYKIFIMSINQANKQVSAVLTPHATIFTS
jgi:hypothetical protein